MKSVNEDREARDIKMCLTMMVRSFEKSAKTKEQQKLFDGAKQMLIKYFNPPDILRQAQQPGTLQWRKADDPLTHTKHVFAKDGKGNPLTAFYVKDNTYEIEFEDNDDLPEYVHENAPDGPLRLKEGWYEECENTGYFDTMIYKRNIVEWLDEENPIPTKEEGYINHLSEIVGVLKDVPQPNEGNGWLTEKPMFDHDCILLTAFIISEKWEYSSWRIEWLNFDEGGYWGWLNMEGEEYGDIADLKADQYKIIELPPSTIPVKEEENKNDNL